MNSITARILRLAAIPAFSLSLATAHAAADWVNDFNAAKATAAEQKKDLLLDFTGSDWCGWCIRLKEEVFSKAEFQEDAPKHFVLVELDYPREKKLPEEIVKQNETLRDEYQIRGYPTILLTDATGRPYAQTGYRYGGAEEYVKHLAELRQIRTARDAAFEKAAGLKGVERATALNEALKALDPDLAAVYYRKEIEEILSLDPEDTTGVKRAAEKRQREEELQKTLRDLQGKKQFDEFESTIDRFIESEKLEGEEKQEWMLNKLSVYGPDKLDKAAKLLDDVIAVSPETAIAERAKELKERVAEIRERIEKSKQEGGEKPADN